MNVLFLTRRAKPDIGGVERHIEQVVANIKKQDTSYKFKIISEKDINPPRIKLLGLLYIWWWLFKNRKVIKDADIVHCHDVYIWYWPFRLLYLNKPSFVTFHGWEGVYPIPQKFKLIRQFSAMIAKGNICVGEFIEKYYNIQADYITYGGVGKFSISKSQSSTQKLKILYIGRLEEDTGLGVVIKAMQKVMQTHPEAEIEFLGDGPLRYKAEKVGKVLSFQEHIDKYLKEARFVIASGYLTILEAMAARKLVFAVANNELRYDYLKVFDKYLIEVASTETLIRKIGYFTNSSKDEKKIVEKAYNWAHIQTWEKVAELYLKLWTK